MAQFDIAHVEDDEFWRHIISQDASNNQLSYLGLPSLSALKSALASGHNAGVWLLDGRFPNEEGGQVILNAPNAIATIRAVRSDARILLFSSFMSESSRGDCEFLSKGERDKKVILKIRQMLGKI